jgi:hypothetical protein
MGRATRSGFGYAQVWKTARPGERLYARPIASALAWAIALPVVILAAAIALREPMLLLALPAAYALQVARIAARKGIGSSYNWKYALLMMVGKLGEAIGVLRYALAARADRSFDYKGSLAGRRPA